MKSDKHLKIYWYVLSDIIAASIAWWVFTWFRRYRLKEGNTTIGEMFSDPFFQGSVIVIPLIWVILFLLSGFYSESLYRKSRLNELTSSFTVCLIGCLVIFFSIILNDNAPSYTYFYSAFFIFFVLQWVLTFTGRALVLKQAKAQLLRGDIKLILCLLVTMLMHLKFLRIIPKVHLLWVMYLPVL
jgi:tryptophan-rich sensory protein